MSDTAQEPSMEEILASIRRIISEDGEEEEQAASADEALPEDMGEPEPLFEPEPEPEPAVEPEPEPEDILDLTDMEEEEPEPEPEPLYEEQRYTEEVPEPEPVMPPPPPSPGPAPDRLVSPSQAAETVDAFSRLNDTLNGDYHELPIGNGSITLERLTRELMRPMLREWLDQHLPVMVERLVREEIERLITQSQRRDPW